MKTQSTLENLRTQRFEMRRKALQNPVRVYVRAEDFRVLAGTLNFRLGTTEKVGVNG